LSLHLISASILLGRKARVALLRPDGSELGVRAVRVLWTVQRPDGFFDNGAVLLDAGAGES
jgi:hypothetical protein